MNDLADRLRRLEENPAPDVWDEIERRASGPVGAVPPSGALHRWAAGLVAAAVAVAGIGLLVVVFRPSTAPPGTQPTSTASAPDTSPSAGTTYEFAAEIMGVRPSPEPDSWNGLLLEAADRVCGPDITRFSLGTTDVTLHDAVATVRCGDEPTKYVHIVFTAQSIPHLMGLPLDTAKRLLAEAELTIGSLTYDAESTEADGTVIGQDPKGTTTLGGSVDLTVAGSKS